jgi:chromosome segregation and condensation protein ScpB
MKGIPTPERKLERIFKLRKQGLQGDEIAEAVGLNHCALRKLVQKHRHKYEKSA